MKRLSVLLLIVGLAMQISGQSMLDVYRAGTLKLEKDNSFASGMDWYDVFPDFERVSYGRPDGLYKSVAVAPDGSVFVGNHGSYSISKFDASGKYIKTFGQQGNSKEDFKARPKLGGVVSGKYVFTHESNGHIKLFNLNGDFVKNIAVDYMPLKTIALASSRIALVGHVPMGGKTSYVITIIDPDSGEQNVIKRYDEEFSSKVLTLKREEYIISWSPQVSRNHFFIRALPDGNLLAGSNFSNTLTVFAPEGKVVREIELDYLALPYPEEMKKEFISRIEAMEKKEEKITKADIAPIYKDDFFQKSMPFYYNFLVDAEGNILVFRYVDKDVDHMFSIYTYSSDGKWIGDAIIDLAGYKLGLQYQMDEVSFHGKYLYGILQPISTATVPPQLVRFNIK